MSSASQNLFTCISCSIAFHSADDQRDHYRSDHHRYNMKRRVAGLTPVSAQIFNQKVLERQSQTAVTSSPKGSTCETCGKTYTTQNAYQSHIQSKKHKENELKAKTSPHRAAIAVDHTPLSPKENILEERPSQTGVTLTVDADATEAEINQTIDEKIAAARARLSSSNCLFCPQTSSSLEDNLTHMSVSHSFFIPDADFLVDIVGLITYLGEKIAVGNACIYCGSTGREFRTMDAVRKHMLDKGHCKIAYDTDEDRLEISDFYDFTASYPEVRRRLKLRTEGEEWEDVDEDADQDGSADEVVEESDSDEDEDEDDLPETQVTYGDSPYELVLPSGTRVAHRNIRQYYATLHPSAPRRGETVDESGPALVRKLLADKNSALVPRKGGFGAYGGGSELVKARNPGEAKEAGRHVREFRDQRRREAFKTKVGFRNNNQKHFRDPLLQ